MNGFSQGMFYIIYLYCIFRLKKVKIMLIHYNYKIKNTQYTFKQKKEVGFHFLLLFNLNSH